MRAVVTSCGLIVLVSLALKAIKRHRFDSAVVTLALLTIHFCANPPYCPYHYISLFIFDADFQRFLFLKCLKPDK